MGNKNEYLDKQGLNTLVSLIKGNFQQKKESLLEQGEGSNSVQQKGTNCQAYGDSSHAEGSNTVTYGYASHAEGNNTTASAEASHAEGFRTSATGFYSHAEGESTITKCRGEHASGYWNESINEDGDTSNGYGEPEFTLFTIGNGGDAEDKRHNAFQVMHSGDIYIPDTDAEGEFYEKPMLKVYPFGDFEKEELLFETTDEQVSEALANDKVFYQRNIIFYKNLVLGEKYKVVIGDKQWYLTAIQNGGPLALTDATTTTQSSYPIPDGGTFMIYFSSGVFGVYTSFDSTDMQVVVSKIVPSYKKIDSKYLPIDQTIGDSSTSVMSQKAVSEALRDLKEEVGMTGSQNEISPIPSQNQIIYTTIDNLKLDFTDNIYLVSNEYYPTKGFGILTFTEDLTNSLHGVFVNKPKLKSVILPYGMTNLQPGAFADCSNLESVDLPETITEFDSSGSQFKGCIKLNSINLPSGLKDLPQTCFQECKTLSHIYLPSTIQTIGRVCFQNSGISNIDLNNVVSIDEAAFSGSQLISLDTKKVTTIGRGAFSHCKDLITVFFNTSLNSLGESCFLSCSSLSNVNFIENSNLTTIPSSCFQECTSLNEITIDTNIEVINGRAFERCPLRSITIHSDKITSYSSVFNQIKPSLEFFYTKSSANLDGGIIGTAYPTLKNIVLDTTTYIDDLGPIQLLRNYTTIYVDESLLQQYKEAYPGYESLFKPMTGSF